MTEVSNTVKGEAWAIMKNVFFGKTFIILGI